MDDDRFDGITRFLTQHSRRRVLGTLAAGALTTLLPRRAAAICSPADCDKEFSCGFSACDKITCRTHFSPAGTVCRPSRRPCDLVEVCTGNSLDCPTDRAAPNGTPCSDDGNACSNDVCENGQCVHPTKPDGTACADDGTPCTDDVCQRGSVLIRTRRTGRPALPAGSARQGRTGALPARTRAGRSHRPGERPEQLRNLWPRLRHRPSVLPWHLRQAEQRRKELRPVRQALSSGPALP